MKSILFIASFCFLFLVQNKACFAQSPAKTQSVKDSTPIELLDYHLSKDEFMYYYGKDDTAKAIIHMFYRKRGLGVIDFVVLPIGSSIIGGAMEASGALLAFGPSASIGTAVGLILGGGIIAYVGFFGFPIFYLVRRSIYTRQKLVYILASRERGEKNPFYVLDKLRDSDFYR